MLELIAQIVVGLLRVLADLALVASNVAVIAPQTLQPGSGLSPRSLVHDMARAVRAAARHPWRLGLLFVGAAICVAAAWRF